MAKQSGLGDALIVGGVDVSGDINSIGKLSGTLTPLEVTGLPSLGIERIGGLRDGGLDFTAYFNPTAGAAHGHLRGLPDAGTNLTYCRGLGLGRPTASLIAKRVSYDPKRADDGALLFEVSAVGDGYGTEWGIQATPGKRTDASATNGAAVDNGASSTFGLQAYLHLLAFTGTSVVVKLQDSPDSSVWTDVVSGAFTSASAAGAQRIGTANTQTVARYLRVVTTGTFTVATFLVAVNRNEVAGVKF